MWAISFSKIGPTGFVMAAELRAIKDGINFWDQHHSGPLRVHSDSLEAIHAIYSDSTYRGVEEKMVKPKLWCSTLQ